LGILLAVERTFAYHWDMSAARTIDELEALDPSLLCDAEIRETRPSTARPSRSRIPTADMSGST
jgi:hypothetical protein